MYNSYDIIFEKQIEKLREKKMKAFRKLIIDKDIIKAEMKENKYILTFKNGAIFKCSGWLVENSGLIFKDINYKNFFKGNENG